ncbi:Asp-tRNA(Asn)/Glu-tRNA(Gln) amidotransferase subunit GatB [Candidatus Nanohalococcus occultus]|uniref:Asp-tRNA(Asn)/Glu-tRNA(Gln) amidotransferase subunit GatB n=1 Tax=Candidatus Nanohalococcus occultus TaxID=2978047 RepID=UPI0039E1CCF6
MSDETEVMIGLETHVQLDTDTKLLCGCENEQDSDPNTNVCPTCLGHPGAKPRLNEKVIEEALKLAEALDCDVNEDVFFSRKTYFYPDMSKNFQTTQFELPVAEDGNFEISLEDQDIDIGIKRIHIEEDPAKLDHVGGDISNSDYTLVDYNRAGTPLLEIVTKPDFTSPQEAREYLQQLERVLEYLEIYFSDTEFSIKSDANVSIDGGNRVEVKNITGTKEVEKALSFEISRQKQMAARGGEVEQETRSFNSDMGSTTSMRKKETEEDYGYIFEPDLTRQELDEERKQAASEKVPELPRQKFVRFKEEYGIADKLIESLISVPAMADDFENLAEEHEPELVASWMTGELKKTLNYNEVGYEESGVKTEWIEYVLELLEEDKISDRNAEQLLRDLVEEPRDPEEIVEQEDLLKAEDDEVDQVVEQVIEDNPDAVEDYNSGEEGAINFLVGQVMRQSGGKADPNTAREKILDRLEV